jgi:membrane protease YdiL (CAAX protease family)
MPVLKSIDSAEPSANRRLLLVGAPVLVVLAIGIAAILGQFLSSLTAVFALLFLYWSGCWSLALLGAPRSEWISLYRTPLNRRPLELALSWLPPAATCVVLLLGSAPDLSATALLLVVGVALINGSTEEMFWRGAFVAAFPRSLQLAYVYPAVLFTVLHFAFLFVPGIDYTGGPLALIGGAAAMGLGWGWVVWRTGDLRSVMAAHVLTNAFAFQVLSFNNEK